MGLAELNLQNISKQDEAYTKLKKAIISNELKENTFLIEGQLSEIFGISRTPIRGALLKLANERFVDIFPNKGAFVSRVTKEDINELYDFDEIIESIAIKRMIENNREDLIKQVIDTYEAQKIAIKEMRTSDYIALDNSFHLYLAKGIENRRIFEIYDDISSHIDRLRFIVYGDNDKMYISEISIKRHEKIVEAIKTRNLEAALNAIHDHMTFAREIGLKHLK